MRNRWSAQEAGEFIDRYAPAWGEGLALRTYSSRLLGAEQSLVLHGGGNTSFKGTFCDILGHEIPALFVKASGYDMSVIDPEGHPGLDLAFLRQLRGLADLPDEAMATELRAHLLRPHSANPSIEALVHAFLPPAFIDHTHADAILALTNREDGERIVRDTLGRDAVVLPYVKPGFKLALAAAAAFEASPGSRAMVWMHHGLMTWGQTARQSYDTMIEVVSKAEEYLGRSGSRRLTIVASTPLAVALDRVVEVAPLIRGLLAQPADDVDRSHQRVVVRSVVTREVLDFLDSDDGKTLALTPPLTSDHLIRTKALPLWIDDPPYGDAEALKRKIAAAIVRYSTEYRAYLDRQSARLPAGVQPFDPLPRVILMPGLGALCAGRDIDAAVIAADVTEHTLSVKAQIAAAGRYRGLREDELAAMEYNVLQHAKLRRWVDRPLASEVALVTGAAGAIGSGVSRSLLEHGCHVAVTDLPGEPLESLLEELGATFGKHVIGVPLDVTDVSSVAGGFASAIREWGGVDLVIVNAGIAHVSPLDELDLDTFRRLERVNIEGTLLLLAEAGRHFRRQGTGGDIVVVSTKNVFAPGAKFGAYSATKAASHQLARIASLELAGIDVRVNMVAPDAVFGHGARRSGLWKEVGPDRMRARGLDEAGLEEYYRNRNLLKTPVTARHVANAVLFFATRQTPTTGATIPVDGGLPDATPR